MGKVLRFSCLGFGKISTPTFQGRHAPRVPLSRPFSGPLPSIQRPIQRPLPSSVSGLLDFTQSRALPKAMEGVGPFEADDGVAMVLARLASGTSSTPCGPMFQQHGHGGDPAAIAYFKNRTAMIREYFPGALGCEDFLTRIEIALANHGFNGDNSIGSPPRIPAVPRPCS